MDNNYINIPIEYFFNFLKVEEHLLIVNEVQKKNIGITKQELKRHFYETEIEDSLFNYSNSAIEKILSTIKFVKSNTYLFISKKRKAFEAKPVSPLIYFEYEEIDKSKDNYLYDVVASFKLSTDIPPESGITVSFTTDEMGTINKLLNLSEEFISRERFIKALATKKLIQK